MRETKFLSHLPDVDLAQEEADCRRRSIEDWSFLMHRLEDIELDPTCIDDDPPLSDDLPIRFHLQNQEAMVYRIVGDTTEVLMFAHISGFNDRIGMSWKAVIFEAGRRAKS